MKQQANLNGQNLCLPPEYEPFHQLLKTTAMKASADADGTVVIRSVQESLASPELTRANRGLAQVLAIIAGSTADTPKTISNQIAELPAPVSVAHPQSSDHVHIALREHEPCLVKVGTSVSIACLIAELALAYPAASFAIMVPNSEARKMVQEACRKAGVRCHRLKADAPPRRYEQIVIGTYDSMAHHEVELWQRDILVAYDAVSAISEKAQPALCGPDLRGRLIGFTEVNRKLPLLPRDRQLAMFGFHHVHVPKHGCTIVDVRVRWVPFRGEQVNNKTALSLKKRGIWNNQHRNRIIAKNAKQLASEGHRVLVLADSLMQIENLAKHLPDWPITVDASMPSEVLSQFERIDNQRSRWNVGIRSLVHTMALNRIRPEIFDTIVWAGSGPAIASLPERFLITDIRAPRSLLIVDFFDHHNKQLREWSRQRQYAYVNREWRDESDTDDLALWRCKQFLDRKSRGIK